MAALVVTHGYIRKPSRYTLAASAFSVVNYRNGLTTPGLPPNDTMTSDTPNGVLSGSFAALSGANAWEVGAASYNSAVGTVLGMFVRGATGNPMENNQAAAGGVIALFMDGGEFELPYFETYTSEVGYASILSSYALGCPLYVSPFGLATPIKPAALTSVYTSTPVNTVIGTCTQVPTATSLTLGIRLFGTPICFGAYAN